MFVVTEQHGTKELEIALDLLENLLGANLIFRCFACDTVDNEVYHTVNPLTLDDIKDFL